MYFKVIGEIREIETVAIGHGIRNLNRLNKIYGKTNWRKLKGECRVELKAVRLLMQKCIGMKGMV